MKTKSDWVKIESILMALECINWHGSRQKSGKSNKDFEELWKDIAPIFETMEDGRYDLIAQAAAYYQEEHRPGDETRSKLSVDAKRIASGLGQHTSMAKSDILRFIEKRHPEIFESIPTSKRGLTHWWKSVGVQPKQARGNTPPETKRIFAGKD